MSAGAPAQIPFTDLRLEQRDLDAVAEVLRSGSLGTGAVVEAFEEAFARQLGARHAVAVASCTAALHLAYLAAGVGPGDEVIVPAFTFAATASAVIYCGATPVFADIVGLDDLGVDPDDVAAKITDRTKAVACVHFAGYPAAADRLADLCADRGLALIEDAAHAPSATLGPPGGSGIHSRSGGGDRKLGTIGLAGAFSFFSNKILAVGEGGLLATDDDEVAALARARRTPAGDGIAFGYNYRWDEPRAALALSRLAGLEQDIATRRRLVREYRARLCELDGLIVPYRDQDVDASSCYVMPIMLADPDRRDDLRTVLREDHGAQTSILYPAIHEFTAYRDRYRAEGMDRTELASRSEVTIPLYPHMTAQEQERVIAGIEGFLA